MPRFVSSASASKLDFLSKLLDSGAPPLLWVESLALGLSLIQRGPRLREEEKDLEANIPSCDLLSSLLEDNLSMFFNYNSAMMLVVEEVVVDFGL